MHADASLTMPAHRTTACIVVYRRTPAALQIDAHRCITTAVLHSYQVGSTNKCLIRILVCPCRGYRFELDDDEEKAGAEEEEKDDDEEDEEDDDEDEDEDDEAGGD